MTAQSSAICVVGSANADMVTRLPRMPRRGETVLGNSFNTFYGGKGANQAVTAARLGARVSMVARVGRDIFGENIVRNFQAQGIDVRYVVFDEAASTGVATVLVDDEAHNYLVLVPGANAALSVEDVRAAQDTIRSAGTVVCQLEVPIPTSIEAFRLAKQAGARTILNPAPAQPLPDELLALTDLCVPNETEAETLTGLPVGTLAEAETAARLLLQRGPQAVIVTLGARGALCVTADGADYAPAFKVQAVDPTAAGDAFIGALAVFLSEGADLSVAVRKANVTAALSVTRMGAQSSLPQRIEVEGALQAAREQGLFG
ncbi:MAG: ribokinase [Anaerolineae bacterium]|nr:ribokinase [Thermoflexales bacterium]MDW8407366.1 ribokinase [Anaerolineae bacterium]